VDEVTDGDLGNAIVLEQGRLRSGPHERIGGDRRCKVLISFHFIPFCFIFDSLVFF
jgi:hypothetical protein